MASRLAAVSARQKALADAPKQHQIAMDAAVARTMQEKESGGMKKSKYGAKPSTELGSRRYAGGDDEDDEPTFENIDDLDI